MTLMGLFRRERPLEPEQRRQLNAAAIRQEREAHAVQVAAERAERIRLQRAYVTSVQKSRKLPEWGKEELLHNFRWTGPYEDGTVDDGDRAPGRWSRQALARGNKG